MNKTGLLALAMLLVPAYAFAVDGQVLINQSTVMAAGGFPYTISQSGSYKLSGNLVVPAGSAAIQISASYVTLDLNGFTVIGSPGIFDLILATGSFKGITIRNGTISAGSGPPLDTSLAVGTVLEDLSLIQSNGGGGVLLGSSVIVRRVSYPGAAITVSCPALVVDSLASLFIRNTTTSTACTFGFITGAVL
jgi:hypothetical protein